MAVFWVTEAIPIAATALIPVAAFPLLTGGVISARQAAAPYAHDLIFLFLGGFMLAIAMQAWGLHRRIALKTVLLFGTRPKSVVAGFMAATAFLSMWVSNTATVVMMLPIAMSVVELVRRQTQRVEGVTTDLPTEPCPFAVCLMLGIAYAASIGGVGTLIGTPPNLLLAAYLRDSHDIDISFVQWMTVGLPLVLVFLPITWLVLTRVVFPIQDRDIPGGRDIIRSEMRKLGPMSRAEWTVLVIFFLTAAAWITRPWLQGIELPGGARPLQGVTDSGIAIAAAVVLFAWPVYPAKRAFLLTWEQAKQLPWGILLLFGGGLSLASAIETTGVAAYIGQGLQGVRDLPTPLVILLITTLVVFLTELTSNTATTATFLPILGASAIGLGLSPVLLTVPMAIAASLAFMMPVATPPNAIVFASGEITIPQMCRAGFWLNLIGVAIVMMLMYTIAFRVLA